MPSTDSIPEDRENENSQPASNPFLEAALRYAALGWAVFPCRPRGKDPLTGQGYKAATTDEAVIRGWWERWPKANIAIACESSGLVVLDLDPRNGGEEGYQALVKRHEIPPTVRAFTGGQGTHWYFGAEPGAEYGGKLEYAGLDVKFRGYVIAPPSVHPDGPEYEWRTGPGDVELAVAPDWLRERRRTDRDNHTGRRAAGRLPDLIPEGRRNDTLTSVAGSMRRRGLTGGEILPSLLAVNERGEEPLSEEEVERIAYGAERYEPAAPAEEGEADYGSAQILAERLAGRLRWASHLGKWVEWEEAVWRAVPDEVVALRASEELRAEYTDRLARLPAGDREAYARIERRLRDVQVYSRVAGALNFLKGWRGVFTAPEVWDADPWALNVLNGVVDLRTGELRTRSEGDLFLKLAPVPYDPEAEGDRWRAHLERCLLDPDVRRQVQRDLGRSLVGATLEESLSFWYGVGANGKTTTSRVLMTTLGDYAGRAAPDLLIASKHDRHPTEKADLMGRRLVFSVEVDEGKRLAEATMKEVTGGDRIKARLMRQDFFEFEQTWGIVLVANHKPVIKGTDDAVWRRIRLIPWTEVIPPSERRPQDEVLGELNGEGSAILSWMLEGLADWRAEPYWVAAKVEAAGLAYRAEQDAVAGFLEDCCVLEADAFDRGDDLRKAFEHWAGVNRPGSDRMITNAQWSVALEGRGLRNDRRRMRDSEGKSTPVRGWVGVRLDPAKAGFVVTNGRIIVRPKGQLALPEAVPDVPDGAVNFLETAYVRRYTDISGTSGTAQEPVQGALPGYEEADTAVTKRPVTSVTSVTLREESQDGRDRDKVTDVTEGTNVTDVTEVTEGINTMNDTEVVEGRGDSLSTDPLAVEDPPQGVGQLVLPDAVPDLDRPDSRAKAANILEGIVYTLEEGPWELFGSLEGYGPLTLVESNDEEDSDTWEADPVEPAWGVLGDALRALQNPDLQQLSQWWGSDLRAIERAIRDKDRAKLEHHLERLLREVA